MTRLPIQLEITNSLVRSWTTYRPTFYGLPITKHIAHLLGEAERALSSGMTEGLRPDLCRVLAAHHGPKGAKVPLSLSTVSGCVRPAFIELNPWLTPNSMACYDGGCYLFHARSVPAKRMHEVKVRAHKTPRESLLAAAVLSRRYNLPIRDNQTSDGSLSMSLSLQRAEHRQLYMNLLTLANSGHADVPYLCFSSAYTRVSNEVLDKLSQFKNMVVHVTVSGWHSREENTLRLQEFERYASFLPNTFIRVVNRQDWAMVGESVPDSGARTEEWLLGEIERRGIIPFVIRTPFHSVHPFPGSAPGCLGTRHMAGINYSQTWKHFISQGAQQCCTTGKCKTCPTRCGNGGSDFTPDSLLAARALENMLWFEKERQQKKGISPLGAYTARLLARKGVDLYKAVGELVSSERLFKIYNSYNAIVQNLSLPKTQRRRLVNDSHALVVDGLDRHRLWKGLANKR